MTIQNTRSAILAGATAAILIAIGHLHWKIDSTRDDITSLRKSVVSELSKIRVTAVATSAGPQPDKRISAEIAKLDALKLQLETELKAAQGQVSSAANQAKMEAVRHADNLVRRFGEEHQNQHKEVFSEIGEVKQNAVSTVARVDADIANIKDQVASTRQELERTAADLKRVTGDLGVQSGFIATNAGELAALKMLGERNYFEFHVAKNKQPQRVGDVSIALRKADPKNNRYTLEVISGDIKSEKRDKTVNEPLQFYVTPTRIPYEIVVNEVRKDYVVGYLSAPKQLVKGSNTE